MKIDLLLDRLRNIKSSHLDDSVDRLHYAFTTIMLVFFVVGVGLQQTFSRPLSCVPSAEFPFSWVGYVNDLCLINGTWHTKKSSNFNRSDFKFDVSYYQWVPYMLAGMALSFCVPHMVYLFLTKRFMGLKLKHILKRCHDAASKNTKEMYEDLEDVAQTIYDYTILPFNPKDKKFAIPKSLGYGLVISYLLSKILNLFNIMINMWIMDKFIRRNQESWISTVLRDLFTGFRWEMHDYFPRVTFCDVTMKAVGQPRHYTIQCLLMINILTEKVFLIILLWYSVLLVITCINLVSSIFVLLIDRRPKVETYAKLLLNHKDRNDFCDNYLSLNGRLLIRFVEEHAGSLAASALIANLVNLYVNSGKYKMNPIEPTSKSKVNKKKGLPACILVMP